jgi:hypothetical protein
MSLLRIIAFFGCSLMAFSCRKEHAQESYDIIIYGGTSAGVMATYSAAKLGKSVLLIEPGARLGGLSSGGLGYTDIGNKYAITGLARDFYRRIGKHYGKFEQWIFEPHVAEALFNEYLSRADAKVLYGYRINSVSKSGKSIQSVWLENSADPSTRKSIAGKIFIDASYEGDLMALASVSYFVGREANDTYHETYNGVQVLDGHQFPDGVDPYTIAGDASSGLLWGISDGQLEPNGSGDKKVQAYNYRICLTNDPENRIPIARPEDYDSSKYELLVRLFAAQPDKRTLNDYFIISQMPNGKTDINNRGGFSTDMIGMNYNYPEGSYDERREIIRQHEAYTKGLLYFYATDPRVPEVLQKEMQQWGYPNDEYVENNHWSPQLYIRESRRMIGSYVMTQANCEGREVVDDGIGLAAYTMDSHNCQRVVVNGMVKNEGNVEMGGFGPYPVSYRAIIPKAEECTNLLVPVCLSASHIAYGSIRMEPVFMALAQSAAIAAGMAIDNNLNLQEIDVKALQTILRQDPLLDGSTPEVLVDNDDDVMIEGLWLRKTSEPKHGYVGNYGPSMLVAEEQQERAEVKFIPDILAAGDYAVYLYFPRVPGSSSRTHVAVFDGTALSESSIDVSAIRVEGQTSGEWVSVGSFSLPVGRQAYLTVSNKDADGTVVADAVLFVPHTQ